jgi:glycosyltransferase involved in cell wall biosynthesis
MNRVFLVGENPDGFSGNGLMMKGILEKLPVTEYNPTLFCPFINVPVNAFSNKQYSVIPSDDSMSHDSWGGQKLLSILNHTQIDYLVFVGIDIWRYIDIFNSIKQIQSKMSFKIIHIFPYDLQYLDNEFVQYANLIDIPCVYSKYGFEMLKGHVKNLRYFRPHMPNKELFYPYNDKKREEVRANLFPSVSPDTFVFGFIGPNQIRKDPQKVIKAFAELMNTNPTRKMALYMHTNFKDGVFNLQKYAIQCGLRSGDLLVKPEGSYSPFERMPDIYNALDCFVNCSMQEGLSWTTIQAMLCGTPVIASNSTAHIELLDKGVGVFVSCDIPTYIPVKTMMGQTWIDAMSCHPAEIEHAMSIVLNGQGEMFRKQTHEVMSDWFAFCSDVTELFQIPNSVVSLKTSDANLIMQHSSAGDILMTTRSLEGIKKNHVGLPLYYMTQSKFFGILKDNPYIDKLIDWNPEKRKEFRFIYNPHGEHILNGGFNNLDVKLADMYPYFCKVEPSDFFIQCDKPAIDLPENYVVVHTTGGDPQYRTYEHMDLVVKGLKIPHVQIGSVTDKYCKGSIDLRGILSFTETAWVMKHAKAAIVIDSFPSHLAGALGVPAIVLYGPAPARVVGPIHNALKGLWFDLEPNKLDVCPDMTNCHGQNRRCQNPCINSINPFHVQKNLISILKEVM